MNTIHRGLTRLMRSAVTGECLPLPEDFTPESAAPIIEKQDLTTLVFQGALNCRLNTDTPYLRTLRRTHLQRFFQGEQQMQAVQRVFAAFAEADIDFLPLKGTVIRPLFPSPELRPMADADILIREPQYARMIPILESLGFAYIRESEYDYKWTCPTAVLELHKSMVPPKETALYAFFGTGWDRAVKGEGSRYFLTREDTFTYLFAHMAKHFRTSGIGSRHFLDLYVYRRAFPELDETAIRAAMKQLQLLPFYENVTRLLSVWFGEAESDPVTDAITEYVFSGGSFGTLERSVLTQTAGESKRKSLLRLFFPKAKDLELRYPVLKKHPLLLPCIWPLRWWEALFLRGERNKRRLKLMLASTDDAQTRRENFLRLTGLSEE